MKQSSPAEILISTEARPYLEVQQGKLWELRGTPLWDREYQRRMAGLLENIKTAFPARCARLLDVGSGLGGIDILISRNIDPAPAVWLLDGIANRPEMRRHAEPFNNMEVAGRFLRDNGVELAGFLGPKEAIAHRGIPCDLITSFGAWCFHIEPGVYLPFVRRSLNPGGRLIVEVRADRPDYIAQIEAVFGSGERIFAAPKFNRMVFTA